MKQSFLSKTQSKEVQTLNPQMHMKDLCILPSRNIIDKIQDQIEFFLFSDCINLTEESNNFVERKLLNYFALVNNLKKNQEEYQRLKQQFSESRLFS